MCPCMRAHMHMLVQRLPLHARAFVMLTVRVSAISCSIPCVGGGQQDHTGVCCDSPPMMIQMRRGMLLSIPMNVMPRCAYRDLRCFLADIDHAGAHARHSILSAGIGFCVVAPFAWNAQAWVLSLLGLPCAVMSILVWTLCVSVGTLCFDCF